ncbi:glycerophosphodiester phosphodiesterase [Streptomyces polyrhachis]|uniref:glycerophosphodiester phosphodiesterase n=1 Tax=Streptomyces polyrhachis TaxID=1282885 RepID=A0ABW2GDQ1_9ACTN
MNRDSSSGRGSIGRRSVLGAAALGTAGAALGLSAGTAAARGTSARRAPRLPVPTVIAHRGASGYRPEHTLGSYQLAHDLGAHVIEQDLVPTRDGHLVCRHENEIGGTTDVADHPEFAGRRTTKTVDGTAVTGWFTEDFTLAELRTLRAKERIPQLRPRNTVYNGRWQVPTFEEVLRWAQRLEEESGRPVWLHIETKHPTYFRHLDLGLEERLAALLRTYDRAGSQAPNFLQSFEPGSIQRLARLVSAPGVVLLSGPTTRPWDFVEAGDPRTVADLVKPEGLDWIAGYAKGLGPTMDLILPRDATGKLLDETTLVRDAHARGLVLHPWTHRSENNFLPLDYRVGTDPAAYGDTFGALKRFLETGIDGIFSDNPDQALLAAADFRADRA